MFLLLIAPAIFLPSQASYSCAWDRDTLVAEARLRKEANGRFDVVAAIVGYFDRNPPLYYEMRLKRIDVEVRKTPALLSLYDDAAVAADRLGKSDLAIQWMIRKKTQMMLLGASVTLDDRYRYFANLGTFHAHKWMKQPDPFADRAELQKAIDAVNAALQVNPEGHFSREIYQMVLLDWLNEQSKNPEASSTRWPVARFFEMAGAMRLALKRTDDLLSVSEGLAGLVTLGAAWESADVFILLTEGLNAADKHTLSELAALRVQELLASGRKPFYPSMPTDPTHWRMARRIDSPDGPTRLEDHELSDAGKLKTRQFFTEARKAVDERQKKRTEYINNRLNNGMHPDTHPNFWSEWTEPAMPPYPN